MVLSKDLSESLLRACLTGNLPDLVKTWEDALKKTSKQDLCRVNDNGETLLYTASMGFRGRTPTDSPKGWLDVAEFLLDHGVSANELHGFPADPVTIIPYSPLMTACTKTGPHYSGTEKMVSLLLSCGADPLHTDSYDMTPMLVASASCNLNAIRVLVREGKVPFDEGAEIVLRRAMRYQYCPKTWEVCDSVIDEFAKEVRKLQ